MKNKSFITISLAFIFLVAFPSIILANTSFKDLQTNHWAYPHIEEAMHNKIINGYPDGTFKPNVKVTEEVFVKIALLTLAKDKSIPQGNKNWSDPYYNKMKELKVAFDGHSKLINRTEIITRGEAAVIISELIVGSLMTETDAITYMFENKLTEGVTLNGTYFERFKSDQQLTRAEAITFAMRVVNKTGEIDFNKRIADEKAEYEKIKAIFDKTIEASKNINSYKLDYEQVAKMSNKNYNTKYKFFTDIDFQNKLLHMFGESSLSYPPFNGIDTIKFEMYQNNEQQYFRNLNNDVWYKMKDESKVFSLPLSEELKGIYDFLDPSKSVFFSLKENDETFSITMSSRSHLIELISAFTVNNENLDYFSIDHDEFIDNYTNMSLKTEFIIDKKTNYVTNQVVILTYDNAFSVEGKGVNFLSTATTKLSNFNNITIQIPSEVIEKAQEEISYEDSFGNEFLNQDELENKFVQVPLDDSWEVFIAERDYIEYEQYEDGISSNWLSINSYHNNIEPSLNFYKDFYNNAEIEELGSLKINESPAKQYEIKYINEFDEKEITLIFGVQKRNMFYTIEYTTTNINYYEKNKNEIISMIKKIKFIQ